MTPPPAPPSKARWSITDLAARAERADQLAAVYGEALKKHQEDARAAQIACDRFKQSAALCKNLADEVRGELSWLATELYDMTEDYKRRKGGGR